MPNLTQRNPQDAGSRAASADHPAHRVPPQMPPPPSASPNHPWQTAASLRRALPKGPERLSPCRQQHSRARKALVPLTGRAPPLSVAPPLTSRGASPPAPLRCPRRCLRKKKPSPPCGPDVLLLSGDRAETRQYGETCGLAPRCG